MKHTKRTTHLVLVLIFFLTLGAGAADLRQNQNFNRACKFQLGDVPDGQALKFDDAQWEDANLPHSFSLPYFASPNFYVNYGWYLNHFEVHHLAVASALAADVMPAGMRSQRFGVSNIRESKVFLSPHSFL